MLNGHKYGSSDRIGSGTVVWKARELHAAGEIDIQTLTDMVTAG
jgi:dihydroxy-acid dehydratase